MFGYTVTVMHTRPLRLSNTNVHSHLLDGSCFIS